MQVNKVFALFHSASL